MPIAHNNIRIRQANIEELDIITDFQIAMAKETENITLTKEVTKSGVKHIFLHPNEGYYLVATLNNAITGCLLVLYEWSDWRNGFVLWIHSVYIENQHRNKGIFKIMYNHLKQEVEETDSFFGLRLYVEKTNENARAVYQKLGMNSQHYEMYEWLK